MQVQPDQVMQVLSGFITRTRGSLNAPLSGTTRLFAEGYVDSFGLVELTAALEDTLGLKLPDGALLPEDFETPQTLIDRLADL